jgi:fructose-bisphosphate aldolase class II
MAKIAHMFGASIEAELGHVGSNKMADENTGENMYTEPEEAKEFVDKTNVDALAIAIGTAHGVYTAKPKLDIKRLTEIASTVDIPLVLHGGSGLSNEDFHNCIAHGISKVNIFTDVNCATSKAVVDHYVEGKGMSLIINDVVNDVKAATMKKMLIFGSQNRG